MRHPFLFVVFVGLALGSGAWVRPAAADISGEWEFSATLSSDPKTTMRLKFTFAQDGEKLTGSQDLEDNGRVFKVTGSVKDPKVEFTAEGTSPRGQAVKSTYAGIIESPTKMSGTVDYTRGPGTWTALKRAK